MVQFEENYSAHIEFGGKYLDYDILKKIIHSRSPPPLSLSPSLSPSLFLSHFPTLSPLLSPFLIQFELELQHVNEFFLSRLLSIDYMADETNKWAEHYQKKIISPILPSSSSQPIIKDKADEAALKRRMNYVYSKYEQLQKYSLLNKILTIKILKKFDRLSQIQLKSESLYDEMMTQIELFGFINGVQLHESMKQLEILYANIFCDGLLEEAQGKLQLVKGQLNTSSIRSISYRLGLLTVLFLWFVYALCLTPDISAAYLSVSDPVVYVYAIVVAMLAFQWVWATNICLWDAADVDYVLTLDLDSVKHMPSGLQVLREVSLYTLLFFLNAITFHTLRYYHLQHTNTISQAHSTTNRDLMEITDYVRLLPMTLLAGAFLVIGRALSRKTSYGIFSWKVIRSLFSAPFSPVHLRETFAADILTSFPKVISGSVYATCYYWSGAYRSVENRRNNFGETEFDTTCATNQSLRTLTAVLCVVPLYIRFMQCCRQQRDSYLKIVSDIPPDEKTKKSLRSWHSTQVKVFPVDTLRRSEMVGRQESDPVGQDPMESNGEVTSTPKIQSESEERNWPQRQIQMIADAMKFLHNDSRENSGREDFHHSLSPSFQSSLSLPPWLIMWPYSFNALKYILSMLIVIFGAFPPTSNSIITRTYPIWYSLLCFISTMYSSWWDITVDWKLFHFNSIHYLLRDTLLYEEYQIMYYVAMILNIFLRLLWTLSFSPYGGQPFFVIFEIFRRGMWACLRLEVAFLQELKRRKT